MKFKSFALGGAAIVGLALAVAPADAYTHHPSTPAEQAQTNDLNAQSLSQAQGPSTQQAQAQPSQQTASADTTASPSTGDTQSSAAGQMTNTPACHRERSR